MKYVLIILLSIIFLFIVIPSPYSVPSGHYEKIADAITAKTAKKLKKEKSLKLIGTGGRMMDDIKMMMMGFQYSRVVNIETARELLIFSVNEYLSEINESDEVRPFLHNYPFTDKNIELEIYFRNTDGSDVPFEEICIAAAEEGQLLYYIKDPENRMLKVIHQETFEEAVQILSTKNNPTNDS